VAVRHGNRGSTVGRRCAKMNGMSVDTIAFHPVTAEQSADPELREQLLDTWADVTDHGGAVGFVPPADRAEIGETLDTALERIVAGRDRLGVLRRQDGTARGMGILAASSSHLRQHWRTILRLMVHPELQGQGAGRILLDGMHGLGRELGLEFIVLTVRGGTGIEDFYAHLGYTEFGRNPRAIRVAPGDERDEIHMRRAL
jgi:GNAT superfamily N-acetyltransferase